MTATWINGLVLALALTTGQAANTAAVKDCCEAKLACCNSTSACCVATKKLGCCAKGQKCCDENRACCAAVQSCCAEGAKCCDEGKACCGKTDKAAQAVAVTPACCQTAAKVVAKTSTVKSTDKACNGGACCQVAKATKVATER
jgi:hypothetical protein